MAMEALTNVRKHAPDARQVTVTLRALAGTVELDVVNDGSGPGRGGGPGVDAGSCTEAPATAGYGLIGLEERVTAEGGVFHAGPDSSGHWRVSARIPLESAWRDGP
ncbi:ATP-binding protein [Streptomyces nanshensis]|uniref:ATP-binding protein n=1 Tax=Streptomyces nanshensis TaxID=518642 RepID=UPI003CC7CE89